MVQAVVRQSFGCSHRMSGRRVIGLLIAAALFYASPVAARQKESVVRSSAEVSPNRRAL